VSQLLHSIETNPRCSPLGVGGGCGGAAALVGLGQGGIWSAIGVVVAALAGLTLRQVVSLGKRIDPGRRCSPPQPTGLIKATAKATGVGFTFAPTFPSTDTFPSHVDFSVHVHRLVHRDSRIHLNRRLDGSNIGLHFSTHLNLALNRQGGLFL